MGYSDWFALIRLEDYEKLDFKAENKTFAVLGNVGNTMEIELTKQDVSLLQRKIRDNKIKMVIRRKDIGVVFESPWNSLRDRILVEGIEKELSHD